MLHKLHQQDYFFFKLKYFLGYFLVFLGLLSNKMINDSNYAFVAGIFASLASFFGKLMSTDDSVRLRFAIKSSIAVLRKNFLK
jgi:hypothetical protein